MTDKERQGWIVVGAIFVTMFFIWGAINSGAVFFVPVIKTFGWTRAKLSVALSIGWVTGGAAGPLIGWLADRIDSKRMMVVGATVTGLLWLALSRATSFSEFLAINGLFGICVGAATTIPVSIVIAGWFQQRRGLAMGIAFSGATLGGAAVTMVANYAIAHGGWRVGYATLGTPILLVVVPLIFFFVRSETSAANSKRASDSAHPDKPAPEPITKVELPGLELRQMTGARSFWMIAVAQLMAGFTTGMGQHFVAYLTGIGYTETFAASIISLYLVVTTAGTLLGGPMADRFSARGALIATFILSSLGMFGLWGASHPMALAMNVLAGGFAAGAMSVQMPLVIIESLGIKRFGSAMGITGLFFTAGAFVSPIVTGRIFDVSGSYGVAISSFIVMLIMAAFAIVGCLPLDREQARLAPEPASSMVA